MPEREKPPENLETRNEYSFEAGVEETINRITTLLSSQDYAIISISGPGFHDTNVGKTTLAGNIRYQLEMRGIRHHTSSDTWNFETSFCADENIRNNILHSDKMVLILDAEGSIHVANTENADLQKDVQDQIIQRASSKVRLPFSKIDLRIIIYRPDRVPSEQERNSFDIVIRNDNATDKPRFKAIK